MKRKPKLMLERQAEGDWIAFAPNKLGSNVILRTREIDVVVNDLLVRSGNAKEYPFGVKVGQRIEIRVLNV